MFYKSEDVHNMFNLLNANDINYILTKNIADELPDKLKVGKDIDLIVNPRDYAKFQFIMQSCGYRRIIRTAKNPAGVSFTVRTKI